MLTQRKIDNVIIGTADFSLDRLPKIFDRLPKYKFTREDRKIMAEMLGLKKKPRPAEKATTYISPALSGLAHKADAERSKEQHRTIIQIYADAVPEITDYDTQERKTVINASEFDSEDFAVLELMNKIIAGISEKRKAATSKSINPTRKEIA